MRKKTSRNQPGFGLAAELKRVTGVDLTRIDGVQATVQTVISEAGLDMSRRPSEAHFVSWLGLASANDISGGKVLKKGTRRVVSRLATEARLARLIYRMLKYGEEYVDRGAALYEEQHRRQDFRSLVGGPPEWA